MGRFDEWIVNELGEFAEEEGLPYVELKGGIGSAQSGSSDFTEHFPEDW